MNNIEQIKKLVGDITAEDLKYVDCFVSRDIGIFIPSVGFCGFAVTNHTHPSYSFVIMLTKNKDILDEEIEPDSEHYLAGMLSPDIRHTEKQGESFTRYAAVFISNVLTEKILALQGKRPLSYNNWHQFLISKNIMVYINRFMEEYEAKNPGYELVLDSLGKVIANDLILNAIGMEKNNPAVQDSEMRTAIDYMDQHFDEPITVSLLSSMLNMSTGAFTKKFKKEIGGTPIHFLIQLRLSKAARLIRSENASITEVSMRCGFSSPAHLTACFKKHLGLTPSAYRALYK